MKVENNHYLEIGKTKVTIKPKNNIWQIDFYFIQNNIKKRFKRSAKIKATKENLILLEKEILPELVESLCGETVIANYIDERTNEVIIDDLAKDYFVLQKAKVRPHVLKTCIANFYRNIFPYFKGRTLISIRPMDIQLWQNKLYTKYKRATVLKYRSILNSIFTLAVQNEIIPNNPVSKTGMTPIFNIFSN